MTRTPRDKADLRDKEVPRAAEAYFVVVTATKDEIRNMEAQIDFLSCLMRDTAEPNDETPRETGKITKYELLGMSP